MAQSKIIKRISEDVEEGEGHYITSADIDENKVDLSEHTIRESTGYKELRLRTEEDKKQLLNRIKRKKNFYEVLEQEVTKIIPIDDNNANQNQNHPDPRDIVEHIRDL